MRRKTVDLLGPLLVARPVDAAALSPVGPRLRAAFDLHGQALSTALSTLSTASPHEFSRATSATVAGQLTRMMQAVVTSGTGTAAQIPGVSVAGKTGTAENQPGQPTHAWFIGFAPAQNPQVAVAVLIEHGGVGGGTAAPTARQLMQAELRP